MKLSNDMKEEIDKTTTSSEPTLVSFHTEMEIPNHEIVSMNEEENAKSDWKDKYFFIVKHFLIKISGKKSEPPPEQKNSKTPIAENVGMEEEENARSDIDHSQIWKDVRNFKKYFEWKYFWMNMLLGLAPSAWDIGSDFNFAIGLTLISYNTGFIELLVYARLSLLCIALPGLVYVTTLLQHTLERCTKQCNCPPNLTRVVSNGCALGLVAAIVYVLYRLLFSGFSTESVLVCGILAITVAASMLAIKTLSVIVHTESVKLLAVKTSNYEGSYESSLQLLLMMILWVHGGRPLEWMGTASSLVMIAKSGAENFLTFGAENKLSDERYIWSKLITQAKFIPVFLLTGFFRVGTLALCATLTHDVVIYMVVVPPIVLGLPLIVLLLIKMCGKLHGDDNLVPAPHHLSLTEIVQGLLGEQTCIVLWGRTGREGSRKIQLLVGGYLLLLYTAVLVFLQIVLSNAISDRLIPVPELIPILLASGWIGYGLFIYQVYLFNRYNLDLRKKVYFLGYLAGGGIGGIGKL